MNQAPQVDTAGKAQSRPPLPLRAKGVASIVVPMAALFVALFAVFGAEKELAKYGPAVLEAYATRNELQQLVVRLLEANAAVRANIAAPEGRRLETFDAARTGAAASLKRLTALAAGDPAGTAAVAEIDRASGEALSNFEAVRAPGGTDTNPAMGRAEAAIAEVRNRVSAWAQVEDRRVFDANFEMEAVRRKLFRVLVACGVLGAFGTLFVHLLITGRLVRRLKAVQENARRVAHSLPMLPMLPGRDEIASLGRQLEDAAFLMQERERHLRQSESRYRDLFDRAPIAYEETDREGVVTRFNQEVCTLLKCTPDRVLGRRAWDFISPEQKAEFRDGLLERIASGTEGSALECDYLLDDGSRITLEIRESMIRDASGAVTGMCRSLLDVTERNLAAIAARKVSQYAIELRRKNEQLARALDAARSATEAKSRFLASVSHELRTPLNGIIGFSELMYDGKLGPISDEQQEIMGDILTSAQHLLGLISDILDISKVEAGKMEFRPETSPVDRLVFEVRDIVRPLASRKGVELMAEVADGLQLVIDPARFKQVLFNYLSNAVKFTPAGGRVQLRVELTAAGKLRVEVEDTGIGIAPEDMPLLFNEFRQLPNNRKPDQGTGLGLAVTRHIVEAQGGTVSVRSVLGRGSVFVAELPEMKPADGRV